MVDVAHPPRAVGMAWSKIKTALRGLGAQTVSLLKDATHRAVAGVTPADAAGWFKHCHVNTAQLS